MLSVELNNKKYNACTSKMAFLDFYEKTRKPLVNGEMESQIKNSCNMLWAALMAQCVVDKVEPDFTREDIENWMPLAEIDEVLAIVEAGAASLIGKRKNAGEAEALTNPGAVGTN